jgi:hypothetical protein
MSVGKVSRVNVGSTTGVNGGTTTSAVPVQHYRFEDRIKFNEQELSQNVPDNDNLTAQLLQILLNLFLDVINDGCEIISRGALTVDGKTSIEASFQPPHTRKQQPKMYLPLPGGIKTIAAINHLIPGSRSSSENLARICINELAKHSNNRDLIKLIILIAHEYGHFVSFMRGYHDQELKVGLSLLFSKAKGQNERYTYSVFNEEITAWRIAEQKLTRYKFEQWNVYNQVKMSSLKTYYQQLQLDSVSVSTYCKLSLLGVDLNQLR